MAMKVTGEEQVGAKSGNVTGKVSDGDVIVPRWKQGEENQYSRGKQGWLSLKRLPSRHRPAHVKGLREGRVQVEIMSDHVPGSVALPVQDCIADVIGNLDRNKRELLKDGHPVDQPLQVPVRLHGDESGAPAFILTTERGIRVDLAQGATAEGKRSYIPYSPTRDAGSLCRPF